MINIKINIAIFASGGGTNAQAIMEYFKDSNEVNITCIYSNNPSAYALTRGKNFGIDTFAFSKNDFYKSDTVVNHLNDKKVDLIILAGFMWLVPTSVVENFTILNIHPALLPKYGGKGMYGQFVHEAIIENGEKESGITIHYVNSEYDKGSIILQEICPVLVSDTAELLAERIHKLEHKHYPETISKVVKKLLSQKSG